MGKIILNYQISLDGVVSDPDKWANIDDELLQDSIERYDNMDAAIFGSKTYAGMAEYWQNAEKSSESALERELAKKLNAKKKYVISRSPVEIVWKNSEQLKITDIESLAREIGNLKNSTEKDVTVESGLKLWQIFIQNSLFDVIYSQIHPVIAGSGEKLFDGVETKIPLHLSDSKTFNSGVVSLYYRKNNN